jgi:hypothetical protein
MLVFEKVFGIPADHSLRLATPGRIKAADGPGPWEHEEYDGDGRLWAVYESWPREGGGIAFLKYSPYGWVLSISGRSPWHLPRRARVRQADAA